MFLRLHKNNRLLSAFLFSCFVFFFFFYLFFLSLFFLTFLFFLSSLFFLSLYFFQFEKVKCDYALTILNWIFFFLVFECLASWDFCLVDNSLGCFSLFLSLSLLWYLSLQVFSLQISFFLSSIMKWISKQMKQFFFLSLLFYELLSFFKNVLLLKLIIFLSQLAFFFFLSEDKAS